MYVCVCVMSKTTRRSKRKGKNLMKNEDADKDHHPLPFPHIPDEIIYNILLRVSPEALQEKMRYICDSWYNLISSSRFRKLQNEIHEEKQELIIQCSSGNPVCRTYLLVMKEEGVDFQLTHFKLNQKGRIRASCNGFIVVNDPKNVKLLHVMNLVTKKSVTLPPCGSGCRHSRCGIALTFNSSTQEYKVVHIYVDGYGIEIYTLGCSESAWNRIPGPFHGIEHERPNNNSRIEWTDPVKIKERFLHWNIGVNEYFISMDINDEKSVRTYAPELGELKLHEDGYLLLELGGYLSLMCRDPEEQMISVWILEDFHKQVWFRKCNIVAGGTLSYMNLKDSPPLTHKFDGRPPNLANLVPVATFWCGEVIVFRPKKKIDDRLYVYNIKQNFMRKIRIKTSLKSGEKFLTQKQPSLLGKRRGLKDDHLLRKLQKSSAIHYFKKKFLKLSPILAFLDLTVIVLQQQQHRISRNFIEIRVVSLLLSKDRTVVHKKVNDTLS